MYVMGQDLSLCLLRCREHAAAFQSLVFMGLYIKVLRLRRVDGYGIQQV